MPNTLKRGYFRVDIQKVLHRQGAYTLPETLDLTPLIGDGGLPRESKCTGMEMDRIREEMVILFTSPELPEVKPGREATEYTVSKKLLKAWNP